MKVAKFGGSSVKDAEAMQRCAEIVAKDKSLGLVIISATYNTTNVLEKLCILIEGEGLAAKSKIDELIDRHRSLAIELSLTSDQKRDLEGLFAELSSFVLSLDGQKRCELWQKDQILSWGERVSSFIFYSLLFNNFESSRSVSWLDACDYIATDSNFGLASPLIPKIKKRVESNIKEAFDGGELFVTQGFVGRDENGKITTLGREGSDYSAALFANALDALEVQIWTDVDGIFNCDPNIVKAAKRIPHLSYEQATTMAKAGAKVLFGKTLSPLIEQKVPVIVKSTFSPDSQGTLISFKAYEGNSLLGITYKKRSDGIIMTLVGQNLEEIEMEQGEIDRGEGFRSFFIPNADVSETLNLWFNRYFT